MKLRVRVRQMPPVLPCATMVPARWTDVAWRHIVGVGVAAALAVAGCANPIVPDDPGPVVGQGSIARPQDGFSVTFPSDWTIHDQTDRGPARGWEWPANARSGIRLVLWAGSPKEGAGSCYVQVDSGHARLTLKAYVAWLMQRTWSEPVTEPAKRSRIRLPAGSAWRIDAVHDSGWLYTEYILAKDGEFYILGCRDVPWLVPDDRWLSIVETFAFLSEE